MISVLNRLVHLSSKHDPLQEVIRSGLLAFSSTIYMTRHYMQQPYEHLFNLFSSALFKLCQPTSIIVSRPILLWLMILYHIVAHEEPSPTDWPSVWLDKAVSLAGVDTWSQVQSIVTSVMWVGFVHDAPARSAFEAAIQRLERLKASNGECASLGSRADSSSIHNAVGETTKMAEIN